MTHVLRVCLIADMPYRLSLAAEEKAIGKEEAVKLIRRQDEDTGRLDADGSQQKRPLGPIPL